MATTTNYGWTTPDDTSLVKDGASAIRTLGTSVDTTTKNLNPETTLGDIAYRSSTSNVNTRLGIGSTGQVLTVAAGVPSWAAVAGGKNWSLLNSGGTTLTGATTITVSGISSKDNVMVIVDGASATLETELSIRFNTDTAGNYATFGQQFNYPGSYQVQAKVMTFTATSIPLAKQGFNGGDTSTGFLIMQGANSSGLKVYQSLGAGESENNKFYNLGGYYNSASTISSVSIVSSIGNFDAGKIYIYTSA